MIINPYSFGAPVAATPYMDAVLADSPLLYLRLREAVNPLPNYGSTGVTGNFVGTSTAQRPTLTLDAGDLSLGLSSSGYVQAGVASSFALASNFTYECLINADNLTSDRALLARGNGGAMLRLFGGQLQLVKSQIALRGTSPLLLSTNTRYHIALTVDASGVSTFYVNGAAAGTGSVAADYGTALYPLTIGAERYLTGGGADQVAGYYSGLIDEAAVYGTALSAARIAAHSAAAGL